MSGDGVRLEQITVSRVEPSVEPSVGKGFLGSKGRLRGNDGNVVDRPVEVGEIPLVESERHTRFSRAKSSLNTVKERAMMSKIWSWGIRACLSL